MTILEAVRNHITVNPDDLRRKTPDEAIVLAIDALRCAAGLRPGITVNDIATVATFIFEAFHSGMRTAAATARDQGAPSIEATIRSQAEEFTYGGPRNWNRRDSLTDWAVSIPTAGYPLDASNGRTLSS